MQAQQQFLLGSKALDGGAAGGMSLSLPPFLSPPRAAASSRESTASSLSQMSSLLTSPLGTLSTQSEAVDRASRMQKSLALVSSLLLQQQHAVGAAVAVQGQGQAEWGSTSASSPSPLLPLHLALQGSASRQSSSLWESLQALRLFQEQPFYAGPLSTRWEQLAVRQAGVDLAERKASRKRAAAAAAGGSSGTGSWLSSFFSSSYGNGSGKDSSSSSALPSFYEPYLLKQQQRRRAGNGSAGSANQNILLGSSCGYGPHLRLLQTEEQKAVVQSRVQRIALYLDAEHVEKSVIPLKQNQALSQLPEVAEDGTVSGRMPVGANSPTAQMHAQRLIALRQAEDAALKKQQAEEKSFKGV